MYAFAARISIYGWSFPKYYSNLKSDMYCIFDATTQKKLIKIFAML